MHSKVEFCNEEGRSSFKSVASWLTSLVVLLAAFFLTGLFQLGYAAEAAINHKLTVKLIPDQNKLHATDEISFKQPVKRTLHFSLHSGLKVESVSDNAKLQKIKSLHGNRTKYYSLSLVEGSQSVTVRYSGIINQVLEAYGKEQARGFRSTDGIISSEGVFLSGRSNWYPDFINEDGFSFDLSVELPGGWSAVSQGARTKNEQSADKSLVGWQESSQQEEIYLIAGRFYEYSQRAGKIAAQVFLRSADESLANKYLQATSRYLEMYEKLLGPYPYSKFALVENFWETGYGMPSFTLLGSRVIRLPFILNSSYPHEILHNWWGNGVYVDYQTGNWSEGLTAYLADHLIKEQQGQGAAYRQQSLQKYADYAARGRDFALAEFRGRHSSASEAVGYGKALMLFHMLRRQLGDRAFSKGLQGFYKQHRFRKASFEDLRLAFEKASGNSLQTLFDQWVNRAGAPALALGQHRVERTTEGYVLHFELIQTQGDDTGDSVYELQVPLAITLENTAQTQQATVLMNQQSQQFSIALAAKPLRLDIDPEFDLFRKLAIEETPAAYTRVFGSKEMLVLLPREADPSLLKPYQTFAEQMKKMGPEKVSIQWDDEVKTLPEDKAVTLLGWKNRFIDEFKTGLQVHIVSFDNDGININNKTLPYADSSFAFTLRRQNVQKTPLSLIATDTPAALPGLARKLPHYHKYSYVGFTGNEPSNHLKGRWPVKQSPMTAFFVDNAERGALEKRQALAGPAPMFNAGKMMESIRYMAAEERKGRGFGEPALDEVANFIAGHFAKSGLQPGGDEGGSYFQTWKDKGGKPVREAVLKNVVGVIPGSKPKFAGQSVVIGAHYDHLGLGWPDVRKDNKGKVHYGADDNASGVAVLLELARVYGQKLKPERTIILVAFSGEEAGRKGSKYFLTAQKKYPAKDIIGMLNLDTVGRLDEKKILVLGGNSATEWPHIFRGIGFVTGIQTTMVNEDFDASDQISFHEAGIPAVQLFSGANLDYHRPTDTIDKIDAKGLVKVARVSSEVMEYLASREDPMTATLTTANTDASAASPKQRNVSLGTVPDFTWTGSGYRLDGVVPGSPAEQGGLQKGDVIVEIGGTQINSIRDTSDALKALKPGQKVVIKYQRGDLPQTTKATLSSK